MEHPTFHTRFEFTKNEEGFYFTFYCSLSNIPVYTSPPIHTDSFEQALITAKELARPHFNRCTQCGRWISDSMYNLDEMQCFECFFLSTQSHP